jgi:hypothetical protein
MMTLRPSAAEGAGVPFLRVQVILREGVTSRHRSQVTGHRSQVTGHTSPALYPATDRIACARGGGKLDLDRCLQHCDDDDDENNSSKSRSNYPPSLFTFCPAATVPLAGSTANPSDFASAGTSNANSPGSFTPQLPTTTSEAAAAPVLSPTVKRRVLVEPAGKRGEIRGLGFEFW